MNLDAGHSIAIVGRAIVVVCAIGVSGVIGAFVIAMIAERIHMRGLRKALVSEIRRALDSDTISRRP